MLPSSIDSSAPAAAGRTSATPWASDEPSEGKACTIGTLKQKSSGISAFLPAAAGSSSAGTRASDEPRGGKARGEGVGDRHVEAKVVPVHVVVGLERGDDEPRRCGALVAVAHVEHLGRFLHELLDGGGVGAQGRVVALEEEEVVGRLRGCADIAGRAAAAEQDGVRLKELIRCGLKPFWVAGCAGRTGHVGAIFDPDEPRRMSRVVALPAAPCACTRHPLSRPNGAASASDTLGPGPDAVGRRPHFTSRRRWRVARLRASVGCVQLMPLPRPQTTWRPLVSSRTRWRVARLILRAGVGRVQLMPLSHTQMCVEWSVCAAAEPADDAATALCEQKRAASCESDAARRRRSRAADADATASRSNVCGVVRVCRC